MTLKYRQILLLVFLLMSVNLMAAKKDNWTINTLMTKFAQQFVQTKSRRYRFTETKTTAFLGRPLVYKGQLNFVHPNTMEKIITAPKKRSYRIVGSVLFIEKENKKPKKVELDNYPELLALSESLRAIFSGKLAVVKKHFSPAFSGLRESWKLVLTPKNESLEEKIRSIEIHGSGFKINRVIIIQSGRSRSVLVINEA